jgi:hypothetical protein
MRRLHAKKKGKDVMRPVESSEGVASSGPKDTSSTASSGAKIMALVGGLSCNGDVATNSNVQAGAGELALDPTLLAALSVDVVGVTTASKVAQAAACPVVPSDPARHHVEAVTRATPRSSILSLIAHGR